MSKVFVVGYTPPDYSPGKKIEAANYRTWQFIQPALEDGHEIFLVAADHLPVAGKALTEGSLCPRLHYQPVDFGRLGWPKKLQHLHDEFKPDCIAAVNFDCCLYATRLNTSRPIWMDIYGDYLTIVQAARYRAQSNRGIPTNINFMRSTLQCGDIFSVCGERQAHALVGELAMSGRLNCDTFGYDFSRVVLPGANPCTESGYRRINRDFLADDLISEEDFIVLWCGGYNTWTDIETLFAGLEWAMAQDPSVHFVSVGGSTYQAHSSTYDRLLEKISGSACRERYHMLGWRPWSEVARFYSLSDVGLNIDAMHYETIYGTRTRLVEMIAAGLPVITSMGTELSCLLEQGGAALTFQVGDWRSLGEQILVLANDLHICREMAESAWAYAHGALSFSKTTEPFRSWLISPHHAPDNKVSHQPHRLRELEYQGRAILRQVLWRVAGLYR